MSRCQVITHPGEGSTFRWPSTAGVRIAAVALKSVFARSDGAKVRWKPRRLCRADSYDVRSLMRLAQGQRVGLTTNTTRFLLGHQNRCPSQDHALTVQATNVSTNGKTRTDLGWIMNGPGQSPPVPVIDLALLIQQQPGYRTTAEIDLCQRSRSRSRHPSPRDFRSLSACSS